MVPIPMDSLKKARPKAVRMVIGPMTEKSGANKNVNPSFAPGKVSALISHIIIKTNNNGINVFVTLSIPFRTPSIITIPTIPRNRICHKIGAKGEARVSVNLASAISGVIPMKSPLMALNIYEYTHPATEL